jgi:hypothetical protein
MIEFDLVGTPLEGPKGKDGYVHLVDLSDISGPGSIGSGSYLLVPVVRSVPNEAMVDQVDLQLPYNNLNKRIAMYAYANTEGVDVVVGISDGDVLTPINTVPPTIQGQLIAGETLLKATDGTWLNNPTSFRYEWTLDGVAIPGAVGVSYATSTDDKLKVIGLNVYATNDEGESPAVAATGGGVLQDPASIFPEWDYLPFLYVYRGELTPLNLTVLAANPTINITTAFESGVTLAQRVVDTSQPTYTTQWNSVIGGSFAASGGEVSVPLTVDGTGATYNGNKVVLSKTSGLVSAAAGLAFSGASQPDMPARIRFSAMVYAHQQDSTTILLGIGESGVCEATFGIHWSKALFFRLSANGVTQTVYTPSTLINQFNPHTGEMLLEAEWVNDPESDGGHVEFYVNGVKFGITELTATKVYVTANSTLYSNNVLGSYLTSVDNLEINYLRLSYKRLDPVISYAPVSNGTISKATFESLYVDTRTLTTDRGNQRLDYTIDGVANYLLIVPDGVKGSPPPANPFTVLETGTSYATLADAVWAIGNGTGTIEIQPGVYGDSVVQNGGSITYQGSTLGPVIFDGGIAEQKAALVLRGVESVVRNIEFRNMKGDETNEAGIRHESDALLVENCIFRDSYNGLIIGGDRANSFITIKNTRFTRCGYTEGGPAHSVYIGQINTFTLDNCQFDRGTGGHYVKCRARAINMRNCSIDDTFGQGVNYLIDLSNGATGVIDNNILIQGRYKDNALTVITISPEGQLWSADGLVISDNTVSFANYPVGWSFPTNFVTNWYVDDVTLSNNTIEAGFTPYVDNFANRATA